MSEAWKQWEGRLVDATFPLRQYLGGSEYSAVFLTERGKAAQKAAIKFIQVDEAAADLQLSYWRHAAELHHPHLLRVFEFGHSRIENFDLLYVVTEFANENLSQFLPQRPLTPAEARDMLSPVLDALTYLHRENLVHGHLRPSNIFAVEDQLKLSADGVSEIPAPNTPKTSEPEKLPELQVDSARLITPPRREPTLGELAALRHASPYDAPEVAQGTISAASDIWSLGMTLGEALTQRLPVMPVASTSTRPADPVVPETLPALFLDIVRHCLQHDPAQRWTVKDIGARLNPTAAAATAAAAPKGSTVASEPVAPVRSAPPVVGTGVAEPYHAPPPARPPLQSQVASQRDPYRKPRYDMALPKLKRPPLLPKLNYAPIFGIAFAVIFAVIIVAKLFTHHPRVQQTTVAASTQPAAKEPPLAPQPKNQPKVVAKPKAPAAEPSSKQLPVNSAATVAKSAGPNNPEKQKKLPVTQQSVSSQPPSNTSASATNEVPSAEASSAPAVLKEMPPASPAATNVAETSSAGTEKGEVLEQIMPEPSAKAQATIFGKVRVRVKLHVDSSGNVTTADFDSPGPSKYFADLALKAARQWDFAPAKVDGHNVASDWLVRFEFSQTSVKAFPTQASP